MQAKIHIVKAMVFPIVMYRCESWLMMVQAIALADLRIVDHLGIGKF